MLNENQMGQNKDPLVQTDSRYYICDQCDWLFLMMAQNELTSCPYCHESTLAQSNSDNQNYPYTVERLVPYTVSNHQLDAGIAALIDAIPFTPTDLVPKKLYERMQRIFIPMWLVDSEISAFWQAELGYDYQVVSHQDRYDQNRGGWKSNQIEETRIRWEPRLGKLNRQYNNVVAQALEHEASLRAKIGAFDWSNTHEFTEDSIRDVAVRLPDREPEDAWESAKPTFHALAAEECRKAGKGDHIRQFSWKPEFSNNHWTLLLLPIYSSYYLNDEGRPQKVLINGQTGKVYGKRSASIKRAQRTSWVILAVALSVFLISVALSGAAFFVPPLLAVGAFGLAVSFAIALGAIYPIATVWWFNRQQSSQA